ncbi:MAG TPA: hypothetical protein VII11_11150 [Bacteroidota bacterium]
MTYRTLFAVLLVFLAFVVLSCSKDESSSTGPDNTPAVAQYAGVWTGTTGQSQPVYFRINSSGEVDSLTIRIRMSIAGVGTCTATFVKDSTTKIQGNSFVAKIQFSGASFVSRMRATLGSSSSSSGTYDGYSGGFSLICGSSFTIGTGSPLGGGTWTATKTGQ